MKRMVGAGLVLGMLGAGSIAAVSAPAAASSTNPVAIWEMNEGKGATVMADSSGNGHTGTIGDEITTGYASQGIVGYKFPFVSNNGGYDPGHVVTVPNSSALNPGSGNFSVTVSLEFTVNDRNIIQKGQSGVTGGYWKMDIDTGVVDCLFRGSSGSGGVGTPKDSVNDGKFHTITCTRTATQVQMTVDGKVVATKTGATGTISNSSQLAIGGKTSCNGSKVQCDPFVGTINRIEIDAPS